MALLIQYGNGVVTLPQKAAQMLTEAEKTDIAVLVALLSDAELCHAWGTEAGAEAVARAADCSTEQARAAVAFWRGAGVLSVTEHKKKHTAQAAAPKEQAEPKPQPKPQPKPAVPQPKDVGADAAALLKKSDDLPKYTTAELGNLLEARPETAELLGECQNLFGKLFSTHEVNTVLGLTDYLGLDAEYVLILVTHYCRYCKEQSKRPSVRGLEKLAISLYDRGITDMAALQEELLRQEELQKTEGKLRSLFGIGARALTAKERKAFSTWLHTYKFGMDMITLAYEIAVDATGNASVAYVNSILDRWNSENIRTPDEVEADRAKHDAKSGKGKSTEGGSFETDDFFDAAMRKSLGENYSEIMKKE